MIRKNKVPKNLGVGEGLESADLVRELIKSLLKRQSTTYAEFADAMGVSLPTVKRWLTQDDFNLSRLTEIAKWFGFSFFEFLELAKSMGAEWFELTVEQENYLVQNRKAAYVNLLLIAGLSQNEILRKAKIDRREFDQCLAGLEEFHFLQRWPGERVRHLLRGPYRIRSGGAFERAFFRKFKNVLIDHFQKKSTGFHYENKGPFVFRPFEMYLSNHSCIELGREMNHMIQRYRERSKLECATLNSRSLQPVGGMIGIDFVDAWSMVLLGS